MALGCVQCPPTRMLSVATMTAQRQEAIGGRSGIHFRPGIAFITLLTNLWLMGGGPDSAGFAARAATTERVVANRYSGLAIEGYDPVAYFTDAAATQGRPEYEAAESGVVWRFRN